jgi:hypothetical protein
MVIKAADMLIARRANTRARADFATWKMMAKLNGASSLPAEAQSFLATYREMLKQEAEPEATEATIALLYSSYYAKMGGVGEAPDVPTRSAPPVTDNVTAFKRPPPARLHAERVPLTKPRLPVALTFVCLVVVYAGIRYLLQ